MVEGVLGLLVTVFQRDKDESPLPTDGQLGNQSTTAHTEGHQAAILVHVGTWLRIKARPEGTNGHKRLRCEQGG